MLRSTRIAIGMATLSLAPTARAQPPGFHKDSLRLRYMRMWAQSTNDCNVLVHVVNSPGSTGIETPITPANVDRWIDTATAFAARKPNRAKGQVITYAWIPITLGISRTITNRYDEFSFSIGGHGIAIFASEIPRIAKLLHAAATATLAQSRRDCPTEPDG